MMSGRFFRIAVLAVCGALAMFYLLNELRPDLLRKTSDRQKVQLLMKEPAPVPVPVLTLQSIALPPPPPPETTLPQKLPKVEAVKVKPLNASMPVSREVTQARKISPLKVRPLSGQKAEASPAPVEPITVEPMQEKTRSTAPVTKAKEIRSAPIKTDPAIRQEGRFHLRLLEHGKGPAIDIAWPSTRAERERLLRRLVRCEGALVLAQTREGLWQANDRLGTRFVPDKDRFSGFMWAAGGELSDLVARRISAISARHGLRNAAPVMLMTRAFDSELLGGLGHLAGERWATGRRISAAWHLEGTDLFLENLVIDGERVDGVIAIRGNRQCA